MRYATIYTPQGKGGRPRGVDVGEDHTTFYSEREKLIISPGKIEVTTYRANYGVEEETWPGRTRLKIRDLREARGRLKLKDQGDRKTSEDEMSIKQEQHDLAVRGRTTFYGTEQVNQEIKKEVLAKDDKATEDKPEKLRQLHKSTQTEENDFTVINIYAEPLQNIFGDTRTPVKSAEQGAEEQSPTDVILSSTLFNEAEKNQPTKLVSRDTGVEEAPQRDEETNKLAEQIKKVPHTEQTMDVQRLQYNNHSGSSDGCDRPTVAAGNNGKVPSLKPITEWKNVPPDIPSEAQDTSSSDEDNKQTQTKMHTPAEVTDEPEEGTAGQGKRFGCPYLSKPLGEEIEPPDSENHDVSNGGGNHDVINARGSVTEGNGENHGVIQKLVEQFEQRFDQQGEKLTAAFEAHDKRAAHLNKEIVFMVESELSYYKSIYRRQRQAIEDTRSDVTAKGTEWSYYISLDELGEDFGNKIGEGNDKIGEYVGHEISGDEYGIEKCVGSEIGEGNNKIEGHARFRRLDGEASEASGVAYYNGEAIEASGGACGNIGFNPGGGENMSQVKGAERWQEGTKGKVAISEGDVYAGRRVMFDNSGMYMKDTIETGIGECGEGEPDQMINDIEPSYAGRYGAAIGTGYITRPSQVQEARTGSIRRAAEMEYDGHKIQKLCGIFGCNGPGLERVNRGSEN